MSFFVIRINPYWRMTGRHGRRRARDWMTGRCDAHAQWHGAP
jgi:hypothetical protein